MNKYTLILLACLFAACGGPTEPKTGEKAPTKDTVTRTNVSTLTLPVLDALFYEKNFTAQLKDSLGLSSEQIEKLKSAAHTSLRELSEDGLADAGSTRTAMQQYRETLKELLGEDKAQQLERLVAGRYTQGIEGLAPTKPNFVPSDTRIVVNAPAFRMDIFEQGKLTKSYRVGIGYPEFPLPTGMRRADTVIFNPSWTPPDEPWVRGNFSPGQKVSAANELNPLGVVKIPIGMPSLIHGGKPEEKIGNFASHGCVGLTNKLVSELAPIVLRLGGAELSEADIRQISKDRSRTRTVKLKTPVPVDLRYESIVAENGALHIYRDVYERGTNTLANAKAVLSVYGVAYERLNEQERADLDTALTEMNRDARGQAIAAEPGPSKDGVAASKVARSEQGKVTRKIKGEKEAVVPIAALAGKGYPSAAL